MQLAMEQSPGSNGGLDREELGITLDYEGTQFAGSGKSGWGDVHSSIIYIAKQALQPQLGGDLVARSEERVYIDDDEALRRQHRVA